MYTVQNNFCSFVCRYRHSLRQKVDYRCMCHVSFRCLLNTEDFLRCLKIFLDLALGIVDGACLRVPRCRTGDIRTTNERKHLSEVWICKVAIHIYNLLITFVRELSSTFVFVGVSTTNVGLVSRDICARPNTFLLETTRIDRGTWRHREFDHDQKWICDNYQVSIVVHFT